MSVALSLFQTFVGDVSGFLQHSEDAFKWAQFNLPPSHPLLIRLALRVANAHHLCRAAIKLSQSQAQKHSVSKDKMRKGKGKSKAKSQSDAKTKSRPGAADESKRLADQMREHQIAEQRAADEAVRVHGVCFGDDGAQDIELRQLLARVVKKDAKSEM